jgi:ABC-type transporter Mla maintaining outer membrane lipid asymmetry ATPase subunit MlaF
MESEQPRAQVPAIRMRDVAVGSLQDLSVTLVRAVNWQVMPGEFWVIAGLQGEGKSDLLMMTGGLMPPLEGEYWLFDELMPLFDEADLPKRLRLGLAFDTGQLFNHLTVSENLALPLRYHRNLSKADALGEVQAMLEAMELAPWADSTPGALGRNWHKRVGLARALMLRPEVLLVDSPLAGLDLRHAYWWVDFLDRLSAGKNSVYQAPVTVVVTSADLRPWMDKERNFAIIKDKTMAVLGNRSQLQAADRELTGDLLAPEPARS